MRFYEKRTVSDEKGSRYCVLVNDGFSCREVEVPRRIIEALDELQKEYWRQERREQRHTVHLDAMPEWLLPRAEGEAEPERVALLGECANELGRAFFRLSPKQQRRMAMHYVLDLPIKKIARIEGCSEIAIEHSLRLATRCMRATLGDDFLRW